MNTYKSALVVIFALVITASSAFSANFSGEKLGGSTKAVFASGIIGDDFQFAFNRKGLELMDKFNQHPGVAVLYEGIELDGLVEVSGEVPLMCKHSAGCTSQCQPGHMKRVTVEISREFAGKETKFRDDRQKVLNGETVRTAITIKLKNHAGEPIGQIDLFDAWPSAYRVQALDDHDSKSSATAVEWVRYESENFKMTME